MATNKKASALTLLDTISDSARLYLIQGGDKGALMSTVKATVLGDSALTGTTTVEAIAPDIADLGTVASGDITLSTTKAVSRVVISGTSATVVFPAGDPRVSQSLIIDSTSGADTTISMPESWSNVRDTLITSYVLPAGLGGVLAWVHDGTQYIVSGDRQTAAQAKAALNLSISDIPGLQDALDAKAAANNAALTGVPTVPTADQAVDNTQAASTAYVRTAISTIGAGDGDVVGPVSSTDNAIARYNGTGGKTLQDSLPTVTDAGDIEVHGTEPFSLTFKDGHATTPNGVTLSSPESVTTSYKVLLPPVPPTAGQVLSCDSVVGTTAIMEWVTP